MGSYRKKPVVIEAFQLGSEWPDWWAEAHSRDDAVTFNADGRWRGGPDYALIKTLEGTMRAENGDWIIRGVKGEIYPCKPDIFEATYEPAILQAEAAKPAGVGVVEALLRDLEASTRPLGATLRRRIREALASLTSEAPAGPAAGVETVVREIETMARGHAAHEHALLLRVVAELRRRLGAPVPAVEAPATQAEAARSEGEGYVVGLLREMVAWEKERHCLSDEKLREWYPAPDHPLTAAMTYLSALPAAPPPQPVGEPSGELSDQMRDALAYGILKSVEHVFRDDRCEPSPKDYYAGVEAVWRAALSSKPSPSQESEHG